MPLNSVQTPLDSAATTQQPSLVNQLLPLCLIILCGFLTVGAPLPVLPLYLHKTLGYSTFLVGIAIGIQSISTLLTRNFAGTLCDSRGSKPSVILGSALCSSSGLFYLASIALKGIPGLAALMFGRVVLGAGESLMLTGALSWGVRTVGHQRSGRVMAWVGIAMYGAIALGAPLGIGLFDNYGFAALSFAVIFAPLASIAIALCMPGITPPGGTRIPFYKVIGLLWQPGLGLALATAAFGSISAFITLYFAAKGWQGAKYALMMFGGAYIAARIFFGGLPDKLGGARVALVSLTIETVGQLFLWQAHTPAMAFLGVALSGFGFSLVFPSFGVEAVKRVPAQNRGMALGAYAAFFDISLGLMGPICGAIASSFGYPMLYLLGAGTCIFAALLAIQMGAQKTALQQAP
jgi:predicted MFS family arabinose efflux permease